MSGLKLKTMNSYLNYLKEVLGLRSVILPVQATQQSTKIFFIADKNQFNKEEQELFEKITIAMKLSEVDFQLLNSTESDVSAQTEYLQKSRYIICFDQALYDYLSVLCPHVQVLRIAHPGEMIKNPNLKKQAWEILKTVIST